MNICSFRSECKLGLKFDLFLIFIYVSFFSCQAQIVHDNVIVTFQKKTLNLVNKNVHESSWDKLNGFFNPT